jgi:hypothetical protein
MMKTKQSSDLLPEPDLQEHQRLILRASRESTERRRRPVLDAISAPAQQLVLVGTGAAVLFLVAVAALFVALLQ